MKQEHSTVLRSVADGAAKFGRSILLRGLGNVYLTLTFAHALLKPASERVRESGSERSSLGYVRKSILRRRGTLSGRPPAHGTVRRGSKKASTSFARPRGGKKVSGGRARRGYVTRRKKGGRAKREAVNLGLLLGNRNSF